MRGLKSLVIVLGVLLVGGTLALGGAIIWRVTHPKPSVTSPSGPAAVTLHQPFDRTIDLPSGAEIVSATATGERLILLIGLPGGRRQLVIVDMGSGARLGTIELRAGQ